MSLNTYNNITDLDLDINITLGDFIKLNITNKTINFLVLNEITCLYILCCNNKNIKIDIENETKNNVINTINNFFDNTYLIKKKYKILNSNIYINNFKFNKYKTFIKNCKFQCDEYFKYVCNI